MSKAEKLSRPTKSEKNYRQYNLSKPKTSDYENLEEGDYLLIPAEKFVNPQYISVSGNTQFDDNQIVKNKDVSKIPSGKYIVVKFIEIQEH